VGLGSGGGDALDGSASEKETGTGATVLLSVFLTLEDIDGVSSVVETEGEIEFF